MFARPKEELGQRINSIGAGQPMGRSNQKGNTSYDSPNRSGYNQVQRVPLKQNESMISAHRMDRLEDVVNKLSNQYDALMPLLNLVENAPLLIKKENLIANLQKKQTITDDRSQQNKLAIDQVFSQVETIKQDLQNQLNNEIRAFENKFHGLEIKMNEQLKVVQQNESKITKQVTKIEGKQREELQISMRKYDQRYMELDNAMKQLNVDVQERLQALDIERQKMKRSTASRRDSDLGILQCEYERKLDEDKSGILQEQSKQFSSKTSVGDKMLKINNAELIYLIENLEKFNIGNTQRVVYELKGADEKITDIEAECRQYPAKFQTSVKDVDRLENRVQSLKGQVEGSQKKSMIDIQQIEEQYDKMLNFSEKYEHDMLGVHKEPVGLTEAQQEAYLQRIQDVKNAVQNNMNLLYETIGNVEDKLQKYLSQRILYNKQYSYMQSEVTNNDGSNSAIKSNRANNSYIKKSQTKLKDSWIKRSLIGQEYNRSTYTHDDSLQ